MVMANEDATKWLGKATVYGFIGIIATLNSLGLVAFALSVRRTKDKRYRTYPPMPRGNS